MIHSSSSHSSKKTYDLVTQIPKEVKASDRGGHLTSSADMDAPSGQGTTGAPERKPQGHHDALSDSDSGGDSRAPSRTNDTTRVLVSIDITNLHDFGSDEESESSDSSSSPPILIPATYRSPAPVVHDPVTVAPYPITHVPAAGAGAAGACPNPWHNMTPNQRTALVATVFSLASIGVVGFALGRFVTPHTDQTPRETTDVAREVSNAISRCLKEVTGLPWYYMDDNTRHLIGEYGQVAGTTYPTLEDDPDFGLRLNCPPVNTSAFTTEMVQAIGADFDTQLRALSEQLARLASAAGIALPSDRFTTTCLVIFVALNLLTELHML